MPAATAGFVILGGQTMKEFWNWMQAAIAAAKQKAGVQRQAASSGLPQQKSPEDILFEAIRNA